MNTNNIATKRLNINATNAQISNDKEISCEDKNNESDSIIHSKNHEEHEEKSKSFWFLLLAFFIGVAALSIVYFSFPELSAEEKPHIKLPREIDDAKRLGAVLLQYTDKYFYQVVIGYLFTYIFLQSFAIPGSIFLSILAGYLFPFPLALLLVCTSSSIGATICYILSDIIGRKVVYKYMKSRIMKWSKSVSIFLEVDHHREHMMYYMVFLRITPILPNWFINIVAPVINVPILPFFVGTFIGVAPPSFIAIQTGTTLQSLTSSSTSISTTSIVVLCITAVISMLPVIFKKFIRQKLA